MLHAKIHNIRKTKLVYKTLSTTKYTYTSRIIANNPVENICMQEYKMC